MSAMSDYLENEILDHILGTGSYTMPSAVYIGLSTGSFGDDNSGTELSGSGYARVAATFNAAASGTADNASAVQFAAAKASMRLTEAEVVATKETDAVGCCRVRLSNCSNVPKESMLSIDPQLSSCSSVATVQPLSRR